MGKRSKKKKHSKSGKKRTPISGHTKVGKELNPPFTKISSKITFSSWMNDRLPEMLWAVIIRGIDGQNYAISEFRRIIKFIMDHKDRELFYDLTHSGIGKLSTEHRTELISSITKNPTTAAALSTLRLFKNLPARDSWLEQVPDVASDLDLLMTAVGATLWHQSQYATDCRWVRVIAKLVSGKLHMPGDMAREWLNYPDTGDQRSVRPSIRAFEVADNPLQPSDLTWPRKFWEECWQNTPCLTLLTQQSKENNGVEVSVTRQQISELFNALNDHWSLTHLTTAIDAKHDAIFGFLFYSVRILDELLGIGVGTGLLGRLGLRTILEAHISLHYLLSKDDDSLWKKWRSYGAGQAKLNA